jgi:hypothetical protein
LILIWYIGIPDEYIIHRIERAALLKNISFGDKPVNLNLKVSGFKKRILFGFYIRELSLSGENTYSENTLLSLYSLTGRVRIDRLIIGKLELEAAGFMTPEKEGKLELHLLAEEGGYKVEFEADDVQLENLSLLKYIGLEGEGVAYAEGVLSTRRGRQPEGMVILNIKDMKLSDISQQNLYIPLSLFRELKGALRVEGRSIKITSLTMKGRNIYSRLKGNIQGRIFTGRLEIMPEKEFPRIALYPIEKYKVSEGYYIIPLSIDLSKTIQ